MFTHFCSLFYDAARDPDQYVPAGKWTLLRFPFGGESTDREGMHRATIDGITYTYTDPESGLIWPAHDSTPEEQIVGHWYGTCHLVDGGYSEVRGQFVRDPLGPKPDSTGTVHEAPSPGMQCSAYGIPFEINSKTPVGFKVFFGGTGTRKVEHAKFKLVYYTLVLPTAA